MADAVISVLLENLINFLLNEGRQLLGFNKQFKVIKDEILYMQSFLKDVDRVRMKEHKATLKTVVGQLREVLYDAENTIEECQLFVNQQGKRMETKCMIYCSLPVLIVRYRMGKKLKEINEKIITLKERMKCYLVDLPLQEHVGSSLSAKYPVLMNDEIVGIDKDVKKIKKWILEAHEPLRIIGFVGKEGTGKTTLAQKICNDENVKKRFRYTLFVTVSQSFELKKIVQDILRKLKENEDVLRKDEHELLKELRGQLRGKYLVILDDVWKANEGWLWWESLKSALPQKNDGSCVIVTTRHEEVVRSMGAAEKHIYGSQNLSVEHSWSLFSKIAFAREGGQCPNQDLERIGMEIINQCKGFPSAIKFVGGMILGKEQSIHEWERMSELLKKELAVRKEDELVVSTLELVYEELPVNLKPCLLCFAVFPEDFVIDSVEMVCWWIGEGFVRGKDGRSGYEIGEEHFNELISRHFLLGVTKDDFDRRFVKCKVHHLVWNMIRNIAKEESFMGLDDNGRPSNTRSRRVGGVMTTSVDLFNEIDSKLLRTIIEREVSESKQFALNVGAKLCQLKWLRVLNISFMETMHSTGEVPAMDWLSGIGSLPHLICFKVENSQFLDGLPDSIGNLLNLKVLYIHNCNNLKRFPVQVTLLEKLTVLGTAGCDLLECLPMGIGNLSHLQELWGFVPANSRVNDGCCVSELKKLTQLRVLDIQIKSEDQIKDGDLQVLSALKKLEVLTIRFGGKIIDEEQLVRKVDYALLPLQQLQELSLFDYPGERTPTWLNPISLPNLRFLCISKGNITHLNPKFFGKSEENQVWKLVGLLLEDLENLEEWPTMQTAMPSLRLLKVNSCPKLKSLPYYVNK